MPFVNTLINAALLSEIFDDCNDNMLKHPLRVSRIIESGNATIVFFEDGNKVVVRRSKDTAPNLYEAVSAAIAIKLYGSNSAFKRAIDHHTDAYLREQDAKEKEARRQLIEKQSKKKSKKIH